MAEAITPAKALLKRVQMFPDEVIEVWNTLIAEKIATCAAGSYMVITEPEVLGRLVNATGLSTQEIHRQGYLNIEPLYIRAGWEVIYDKADFTSSAPNVFKFRPKQRGVDTL